jgi:hypothetical protein
MQRGIREYGVELLSEWKRARVANFKVQLREFPPRLGDHFWGAINRDDIRSARSDLGRKLTRSAADIQNSFGGTRS